MTVIGRTQMPDGRWVELHRTTFKGETAYIVQDGRGTVKALADYNNAFNLYKIWSTPK